MSEFEKTNWHKPEFSNNYVDMADIYIVERKKMFGILRSFYIHFLNLKKGIRILDLGCGDGVLSHELLKIDGSVSATLVDGSIEMLDKARERLQGFRDIRFLQTSFQEIIGENTIEGSYDFIFSSMAIHHLTKEEKKSFFERIYSYLRPYGYFMNIDVILPPTETLDKWYMELWKQWMEDKMESLGIGKEKSEDIIKRYKDLKENKPDLLDYQLKALIQAGFNEVDCYYKYGIFAVFGGGKLIL